MSFLYFLPDLPRMGTVPSDEVIRARGLAYAFEGRPHGRGTSLGGRDGFILGCRRRHEAGDLYVEEASQVWRPHPSGQYFVGHWKDKLPGPQQLAREKQLDGHAIELADRNKWIVPLARQVTDNSSAERFGYAWSHRLPRVLDFGSDGKWIEGDPLPQYQPLWDLAAAWNDVCRGMEDEAGRAQLLEHWLQYQVITDAATTALSGNYVLGPVECGLLKLWTFQHAEQVLDLLIDEPELRNIRKKWLAAIVEAQSTAADAGSTSLAGPAAGTLATNPPSPTLSP